MSCPHPSSGRCTCAGHTPVQYAHTRSQYAAHALAIAQLSQRSQKNKKKSYKTHIKLRGGEEHHILPSCCSALICIMDTDQHSLCAIQVLSLLDGGQRSISGGAYRGEAARAWSVACEVGLVVRAPCGAHRFCAAAPSTRPRRWMGGWEDGRMGGWEDGRKEGWRD
eukprot:93161-Rhodomonas_salina.3